MKRLILALVCALAVSGAATAARAATIGPADAAAHVGQTVTVEGTVQAVHVARSGVTFLDMGGQYPNNAFAGVVFKDDAARLPDLAALGGQVVEITGPVRLYRGKPEIIVKSADQIRVKQGTAPPASQP
jgi:DNA/RNA endonuclease YhcR with UshA esterase domain